MLHADETPRRRRSLDLPGQVLAMSSLAALTAGFINAGAHGWGARVTLALVVYGGLAAAAFVLLEQSVRRPLIEPGHLPGHDLHDVRRESASCSTSVSTEPSSAWPSLWSGCEASVRSRRASPCSR